MIANRWIYSTLALLLVAGFAAAQFSATPIVQTGVNYSGIGTLNAFGGPPSIVGGTICFTAQNTTGSNGVFTITSGTISTVAITGMTLPSGSGTFTNFNTLRLGQSASGAAFLANSGTSTLGVYANVGGSLAAAAQQGTAYPGTGGGTFTGFSVPSVDGTTLAFGGTNGAVTTSLGIFTSSSGSITPVATTSTPMPSGTGNFTSFSNLNGLGFVPQISGSNVVYGGQGGGRFGIYASLGGVQTKIADSTTSVPGQTGFTFTNFQILPAIDGSTIAFSGESSTLDGIYRWTAAGGITRVADTTTAAPGGTGNFTSFGFGSSTSTPIALNGGHIAFAGTQAGVLGIYTDLNGTLSRVVQDGDVINGKTVNALTMSNSALSGNNLAVTLHFTDNSQAIYSFAPVPECGLMLIFSAALLLAKWRMA